MASRGEKHGALLEELAGLPQVEKREGGTDSGKSPSSKRE